MLYYCFGFDPKKNLSRGEKNHNPHPRYNWSALYESFMDSSFDPSTAIVVPRGLWTIPICTVSMELIRISTLLSPFRVFFSRIMGFDGS